MNKKILPALTFDDVLLVPQKSSVLPRDVDISTNITTTLKAHVPIISADMDSVTESTMAVAMAKNGGLGIIHKNMTPKAQAEEVQTVKKSDAAYLAGVSVGVGQDMIERVRLAKKVGADVVVISTAHGHSAGVIKGVKAIRKAYPELPIIAGNVVTASGTRDLIKAGASAVKVGVGPGSICTTRVVAGVGVPQLTAIMNAAAEAKKHNIPIIADGGIRYSGDIVKALAAGAGFVMLGSLLAATTEAPGELVTISGKKYKIYRGMGSREAMSSGSKDRYGQAGTSSGKLVAEGVSGKVPIKGEAADVLFKLVGGLRSGMGYLGAKNLKELRGKAEFIEISNSGLTESHPHDIDY